MSNKTLTARVKLDSSQAERKLKAIAKSIDAINRAAGQQSNAYQKVAAALRRSTKTAEQLNNATQKTANSAKNLNKNLNKSNTILGGMVSKMKRLATIYLGVMGARALFTTADTITASENRLNNSNAKLLGDDPSDGYGATTLQATEQAMNKMYAASQRARTGYADMMANVSKSMVLAGDAFGNNMDNAIAFQETMAKAYTVGGASAAEQASSMYQMIQALGSGILQGDELRSVREGAPLAYKAIEEFAQGVYNTDESLKELASQGKITSGIVVAAIQNASASINDSFNASAMTWAQAWTYIKNVAVDAMRPVQNALNEFLQSDAAQVLLYGIEHVVRFLGAVLTWVITTLSTVINWIADNWYWLKWILITGLMMLGVKVGELIIKYSILGAKAIWAGLQMFHGMLIGLDPIYKVILAIGLIITILVALGFSVQEIVGFIVGIVFAAIALISSCVANVFTFILNLLAGLWNVVKAVATNIGIAFENCWNTARWAFWEFIADCIDGLKRLEPFINWVAKALGAEGFTISGLSEDLHNKANSYKPNFVSTTDAFKSGFNTFEYQDIIGNTKDAYNYGYDLGVNGVNWIGSKLSNLTDKFMSKYGSESIGALDPSVALNTTPSDLSNISDNTDKIADSVEMAEEDLEWLRKLAQLEWKKEYTSNNININMTNNNNVNGESDLDGIVTKLTEKLYEELSTTASGVYA